MSTHVFDSMGSTVSIRFAGVPPRRRMLDDIEQAFRDADERFSLYRHDSELSRIARGELPLREASAPLRECYAEAHAWSGRTGGLFTPHRPDGVLDLSGIVKAQAIETAGSTLDGAGVADWLLNAGGDLLARGHAGTGPWRVGIVDPDARDRLLATISLSGSRRAVATSGTAERGEHVWRAARAGASRYAQVSVIADDILTADVLATALLAGGPEHCDELTCAEDVDVLTVDVHGHLTATPGFRAALGAPDA